MALLSDAIDETRARHRRAVEQGFQRAIPAALPRRIVLRMLRRPSR